MQVGKKNLFHICVKITAHRRVTIAICKKWPTSKGSWETTYYIYNMHISYCSTNWGWYCFIVLIYTKIAGHQSSLSSTSLIKVQKKGGSSGSAAFIGYPVGSRWWKKCERERMDGNNTCARSTEPHLPPPLVYLRGTFLSRPPNSPPAKQAAPATAPCTNRNILVLQICLCLLQRALKSHYSQ